MALVFVLLVLAGCGNSLYGPLDNPVDADGESYQGYESVDDPADIAAVTPGGAALLFPDFMVNQVVGADAYRLEIATTEAFDTPTVLHSADTYSANELKAAAELDADSTYYWRAAAQKGGSWGPWTAARSFTLVDLAHVSPAAGATTPDPLPELSWEPVSGATGYQLQLADSEGAVTSAPIVDVGSPEYAVPSALANDQYHYWRFRATTAGGRATGWSTTRSFFVAAVGAVSNLGAAVGDAEVELTWNDPADSDLAEIRVTQDPDGGIAQVVSPGTEQLTLTGLTNGTTYTFTLVASNTAGDISGEVTVTATPTDVRGTVTGLSAAPAAAEVQLTWSDPSYLGLDSIEISWTPDGTSPVSLTPGTETYTATGLLNGSEYTFTVTALYADGSSSAAETVTVRTGLPDTIAWSGVNPADGGSTVDTTPTLAWDDVFGAARYELQIAETEADLPAATVQNVTVSQYTPGSFLSNWSTYYWRLRALDAEDNSTNWSSVFSFTVSWGELSGLTPADAATGTDTTPTFGWDAVTGADSYEVQIADTQSALSSAPPATTSDASYTPTAPLTNNQTHYWRVRARDADGQFGPWSAARSISVAWGAVSGLSPSDGSTIVDTTPTISWNTVAGAVSYEVQLGDDRSSTEAAVPAEVTTAEYPVTSALANNQTHYVRVRAVDGDGQRGPWSAMSSFAVAWGEVSGLSPADTASTDDTTPEFSWNTVTGAVSYELQIAGSESAVASATTLEATGASYSPTTPLGNDQSHFWRVRAVDGDGQYGPWSSTQSVTVSFGSITGLAPTGVLTSLDPPVLTWTPASMAVSYEVQLSSDSATLSSSTPLETTTASYEPAGLTNNQLYYWRVRAIDESGIVGAWNTTQTFDLRQGEISGPYPPSGWTTSDTTTKLTWDAIAGAAGYEFQISDDAGALTTAPVIDLSQNSYTPSSPLTNEVTYYWRVRSYDSGGQYGAWSNSFSINISIGTVATPWDYDETDPTPTLPWQAVIFASEYEIQLAENAADVSTSPATTVPTASYTVTAPVDKGASIYWRVRAGDGYGQFGPWSSIFTFTRAYEIGDTGPAGGIIFYDKGSSFGGWRYLSAAPGDQSTATVWAPGGSGTIGGTGTLPGTGLENTQAILQQLGSGDYAASIAAGYSLGGYTDWHLPSLNELNEMLRQRDIIGGFPPDNAGYWSSSEIDSDYAWAISVDRSFIGDGYKYTTIGLRVRAIRRFE